MGLSSLRALFSSSSWHAIPPSPYTAHLIQFYVYTELQSLGEDEEDEEDACPCSVN